MLFIILPAYNEAKQIGRVIRDLFQQLEIGKFTVVLVDDGSTDETARIAEEAGAIVLRHVVNRGQGAALETGGVYARAQGADAVVHFDGDGQFNPVDIAGAVERLRKNNFDIVLGSRFLDNRSQIPFLKRWFIFPVSRLINRLFTGLHLTDVHNGFRVLSRVALEKIVITHDGMAHATEILQLVKKYHLRFAEHPIEVRYYKFGQGPLGGIRLVSDLLFRTIISKR